MRPRLGPVAMCDLHTCHASSALGLITSYRPVTPLPYIVHSSSVMCCSLTYVDQGVTVQCQITDTCLSKPDQKCLETKTRLVGQLAVWASRSNVCGNIQQSSTNFLSHTHCRLPVINNHHSKFNRHRFNFLESCFSHSPHTGIIFMATCWARGTMSCSTHYKSFQRQDFPGNH